MQSKNLLQILAEPNLIAINGKESSFLRVVISPYPVVQPSSGGDTSITIAFKEFGVRLKFTPLIMPNGNIHLQVAPEVSSLDYANAPLDPGLRTSCDEYPARQYGART